MAICRLLYLRNDIFSFIHYEKIVYILYTNKYLIIIFRIMSRYKNILRYKKKISNVIK